MPATYDIGDSVKLTFTVRDEAGALIDATTAIKVTKPDGTFVTPDPTITHAGTGTYTAIIAIDTAGTWLYRWTATGAATTAEDGQFYAAANATTAVYTTLAELRVALSLKPTDTEDDEDLQDAILVASRAVEQDCQRIFYSKTDTRSFRAQGLWCLRLDTFNDLVSVTTLKTDADGDGTFETTWSAGDYQLLCADGTPNTNAGPEPRPYTQIRAVGARSFPVVCSTGRTNLVQITGTWGWPQVPDPIRRATRMMAAEIYKLNSAPFGATNIADLGIIRVRDNPKYLRLIADYRKHPMLVA